MVNYIFKNKYDDIIKINKIICLAQTYKKHAEEMNSNITKEPLLFLKPSSSVIFNENSIIIPSKSKSLHHEVELGIVIGKKCKDINKKDADKYILGYLLALDITARDIQSEAKKNGWPWTISKGFDTFAPISEIILKNKVKNPNNLDLSLKVNGLIRQKSNTKNMIYSVERIIEFISQIMTLEKGDLIMTGTPEGVGEINDGDIIEAELDDLCFLKIYVKK
jgi:2-keto-4-pentenoate hydratase/2-oxohepta-3-ene-1,7-dioic acid hydratase in catechol pathway